MIPFVAVAILGLACGDAASSTTGAGGAGTTTGTGPTVDCTKDARAMSYAPNMAVVGQSKIYQVKLTQATPGPPGRGNNSWIVRIEDTQGHAASDATIPTVTPYMPDHKHGTQAIPSATQQGDGSFSVTPLYLFMPGIWTITFDVQGSAGKDSVVYSFCVEG